MKIANNQGIAFTGLQELQNQIECYKQELLGLAYIDDRVRSFKIFKINFGVHRMGQDIIL